MPINIPCTCGQSYSIRDEFAGKQVQCSCGRVLAVPAPVPEIGPRLSQPELPPLPPRPTEDGAAFWWSLVILMLLGGGGFLLAYKWDRLFPAETRQAENDEPTEKTNPERPPEKKPPPVVDDPVKKEDVIPPKQPPKERHPAFEGHAGTVFRAAFSSDGQFVLSASGGVAGENDVAGPVSDSSLRLWTARDGQMVKRWSEFPTGIGAAAFSPGGRLALISGAGKKVVETWKPGADLDLHLWDLREGREIRTFVGHLGEVFAIAVSPDGKHALSGGKDRTIRMWEIETGREIQRLVGHGNTVNALAFSPDGLRAVSCGSDMTVRLWDLQKGVEIRKLGEHQDIVWSVAVAPDGRHAVSGGGWQIGAGNKGLTPGSKDYAIRLWDLSSGKEVRRFEGHSDPVSGLAFTPDSRRVVSAGADRTVRLWLAESGRLLHTFAGHKKLIRTLAVSPDGRRAVSGGDDGELKTWDLPPELTDLLAALRGNDLAAKRRAAEQLGLYGNQARDAVPDLLRAAAVGGDLELRRAALASLVQIGKPQVEHLPNLEPLLLPSVPNEVRKHVLDALAGLGPDARPAAESVLVLLRDPDPELRSRAARFLGTLGPKHRSLSSPALVPILGDSEAVVVKAAADALTALGPATVGELKQLRTWLADPAEPIRRHALTSLAQLKDAARPASEDVAQVAAKDSSVELRRTALSVLVVIDPGGKTSLAAFTAALKDRDPGIVKRGVQALLDSGAETSLTVLLGLLESKDAEVVKMVDEGLTAVKWDKTHAKALGEVLPTATPVGRDRVLKIVSELAADAEDAVPGIRELLKKTEPKAALPIVQTLAKIGPPAKSAGPELVPLVKREPKMKDTPLALETAHLLVELEAMEAVEAVPVLTTAVRIDDEEEASIARRLKAMKALVKIGKPAVPHLIRSMEGEFFVGMTGTPTGNARAIARIMVLDVLATMGAKTAGTPDVLRAIGPLERDPYPEVRQAAKLARMKLMEKDEPAKDK